MSSNRSLKSQYATLLRLPEECITDQDVEYLDELRDNPDTLRDHVLSFACSNYGDEELGELNSSVTAFVKQFVNRDALSASTSDESEWEESSNDDPQPETRLFRCGCEGLIHDVTINCTQCGRIHCHEESKASRCLFCKSDIRPGSILQRETDEEAFEKAINRVKRLLQFQAESAKRTRVIDENVDWFEEGANPWLNQDTRQFAQHMAAKQEQDKGQLERHAAIAIDLATRRVIDMREQMNQDLANRHKAEFEAFQSSKKVNISSTLEDGRREQDNAHLYDRLMSHLKQVDSDMVEKERVGDQMTNDANSPWRALIQEAAKKGSHHQAGVGRRFQPMIELNDELEAADEEVSRHDTTILREEDDAWAPLRFSLPKEIMNIPDKGMVLTLHQPWASLIIAGFKRCEGRGWSTDYRGPLWIHAAAKPLDADTFYQVKEHYESHYTDLGIPMPLFPSLSACPESALLGRITLVDVVDNTDPDRTLETWSHHEEDEYWPPQEDNGSNHLFICCNPERLLVPITMAGHHKLWKLKPRDAEAFSEALRPIKWPEL